MHQLVSAHNGIDHRPGLFAVHTAIQSPRWVIDVCLYLATDDYTAKDKTYVSWTALGFPGGVKQVYFQKQTLIGFCLPSLRGREAGACLR